MVRSIIAALEISPPSDTSALLVMALTESLNPQTSSLLVARAAAKVEYVCHWDDLITGTTVKPLV